MIEIDKITKYAIQLVDRSEEKPRRFTVTKNSDVSDLSLEIQSEVAKLESYVDSYHELPEDNNQLIKMEVKRRINAVASIESQINMTAARADGSLSVNQEQAYHDGLVWIHQMRATSAQLIAGNDADYKDDSKWPICPENVIELAKLF